VSTRFGHPLRGWNTREIATAWSELRTDLMVEWESGDFDYYRDRHAEPFAVRFLAELETLEL
jgi:hypothetical protein